MSLMIPSGQDIAADMGSEKPAKPMFYGTVADISVEDEASEPGK